MNSLIKLAALNITKRYGDSVVLNNVSVNVKQSQFFALLGPSGSGKTTLLRIIAGFVRPDTGKILIEKKDITEQPPNKRNTAMVFQNFSLWPHMTVFENVAFGLRLKRLPSPAVEEKVKRALKMIHLQEHIWKKPQQLSGGQQQRVALARALVVEPEILLLDEPLSNLDAHLRDQLRQEIKTLQKNLGITTIYVTHDQKEAMYLADAIAIMFNGNISEIGSPEHLYKKPCHIETARFLGQLNELPGIIREANNSIYVVETALGNIQAETDQIFNCGEKVIVCFRPEFVQYPANENVRNRIECNVVSYEYAGSIINALLKKNNQVFRADFSPSLLRTPEIKQCVVGVDARDILLFRVLL
ncbi:MAG: ABC transporter ATP-binding protein [Candidatus Omnitrophica bacterium]|nr:ABC transporter ATP-binding protein [Candidatus Omnitrophota bacterium]MCM8829043.1 ABC transporter ATP-binding protein [Candidatus Omnitrophota bacterium]